jgi:hypothetical protein
VSRRTSSKPRPPLRKLRLGAVATAWETRSIPTRWLNTIIGIFLLPLAGVLTQALFTSFSRAAIDHGFWAAEEFWFFALGAVLWTLAFFGGVWVFGEPRPVRVYVFGHELTHAIWVWAMGGRVSKFKVGREGGFILTDTHNVWIALAPYFYPLYSIVVIALYGGVSLVYDVTLYTPVLFGFIGLTWAFHMSFTFWMIPKGQSDLTQFGTFYSLVIIYLMNLLLLSALLIFAAPEVTFNAFGWILLEHMENLAAFLWENLRPLFRLIKLAV